MSSSIISSQSFNPYQRTNKRKLTFLQKCYQNFSQHLSLESQRTIFISITTLSYLFLGGLIFSTIEQPYSDQICRDKKLQLEQELPIMIREIGEWYYGNLMQLRTTNKEYLINDLFQIFSSNITMLTEVLSDNSNIRENSVLCRTQIVNCNDDKFQVDSQAMDQKLQEILTNVQEANGFGLEIKYDGNITAECPEMWEFLDASYFCATIMTTVGYGTRSPKTILGRGICILYSIVGILMTGGLMNIWAKYVGIFTKYVETVRCGLVCRILRDKVRYFWGWSSCLFPFYPITFLTKIKQ